MISVLEKSLSEVKVSKPKNIINASVLVRTLKKLGVECIFGYPGASVLSVYEELSRENCIKHYLVRHEQAALHSAEGYARISGKPGVVLVTSGPGFTNTITGIANAFADSTPLVILAGDVATTAKKGKVFQNVDIRSLTNTCTKKTYILNPNDDIATVVEEAFNTANTGIKGPVVIALPRNLLEKAYRQKIHKPVIQKFESKNLSKEINNFKTILLKSQKPLILVGGGSADSFNSITEFAEKINCPVVSTLMGIGNYPSGNDLYLGMIGLNGTHSANIALKQSDLIIAFGTSFSDRSTCKQTNFGIKTKVVNINIQKISKDFTLEIEADCNEFLNQLKNYDISFKTDELWVRQVKTLREELKVPNVFTNKLHSSEVLKVISEHTKTYKPVVVTDVGQHQMLTAQFFDFNSPRKFITSGGMGTMGFGLPASIGAYIANPENLVLNITGDGSFQMNLQELATCREHNIPVKIIILNNGYLGMVRQLQEKIYNNRYQVEMTNPDFVKIAEAYDLFAIRVEKYSELITALDKAIKHNGTAIIDVMIDSFEEI